MIRHFYNTLYNIFNLYIQAITDCLGTKCTCDVKVSCKNPEKIKAPDFSYETLLNKITMMQDGGSDKMIFKSSNHAACLKVCRFSIFRVLIIFKNIKTDSKTFVTLLTLIITTGYSNIKCNK